jgi:DNA-binding NarL/FixJ family response regulator
VKDVTMSDELSAPEDFLRYAAADDGDGAAVDCASIWRDLVAGRTLITHAFHRQNRAFFAIRRHDGVRSRLTVRNLGILQRILLGADQKVVAYDLRFSNSTITTALKQALEAIGLRCNPSKVPALLVMLAHSAQGDNQRGQWRLAELDSAGSRYQLLSAPVTEPNFARTLSPAVRAVVQMRIEGNSHAEIAARRRTSRRTVANQLAAAFQRLGVSGRSDLVELLVRH